MEVTGLGGLFVMAFLAATFLPLSSELALAGLLAAGDFNPWLLLVAAATGNTLGSLVNWVLGRWCLHFQDRRWFPISREGMEKAQARFAKWGIWSLLLSWVPVIGDPLTFVAGVMRVPFWLFLLLVAVAKTGRYLFIILLALGLIG